MYRRFFAGRDYVIKDSCSCINSLSGIYRDKKKKPKGQGKKKGETEILKLDLIKKNRQTHITWVEGTIQKSKY